MKIDEHLTELYLGGSGLISVAVGFGTGSFTVFMFAVGAFILIYTLIVAMVKYG